MPRPNIFSADFEYDAADPAGYGNGLARVGQEAGGEALAVKLYELPVGASVCPYHYEYEEEWLIVLTGSILLRTPAGEEHLQSGDVVCFPPGPAGAHKVTNGGETTARVLMFGSGQMPAIAVYPDSDKIGVWPGNADDKVMLRRADGGVDYWDGEV